MSLNQYNRAMVKKSFPPESESTDSVVASAASDATRTPVSAEPKALLTSPPKADSSKQHAAQGAAKPSSAFARSQTGRRYNWLIGLVYVAVLVLAVVLGLVIKQRFDRVEQDTRDAAARSDALTTTLQTVERNAADALALARAQADTMTQLQGALAQLHDRYQALQAQPLARGVADAAMRVNDIDYLVRQASQQLRLGGQVGNAIVALEIALSQLRPTPDAPERPEQVLLRQALEDDLTHLRAVPVLDVTARVAQLERLIALTASAPLLAVDVVTELNPESSAANVTNTATGFDAEVQTNPAVSDSASDPAVSWWQRASHRVADWGARTVAGLGRDLRGLFSIRRVADRNALLLAPDQAAQLRATLRIRLLTAQVALLTGQTRIWQSELASVHAALTRYYDMHAPETVAAVQLTSELGEADAAVSLPDVAASLNAVAVLRAALAYGSNSAPNATSQGAEPAGGGDPSGDDPSGGDQ